MRQYTILDSAKLNNNNKYLKDETTTSYGIKKHFIIKERDKYFKKGDYFTITFSDKSLYTKGEKITNELNKILRVMLKKYNNPSRFLLIGLGNSKILADSLGPISTQNIMATYHYDFLTVPKLAIFNPDVINNTGISSFNIIKMLVHNLKPNIIIIIDSLVTSDIYNLNHVIEINDAGIVPGSVLNTNKEINYKTFNIPIISIGSPIVYKTENNLFTTTDINFHIHKISSIISKALNNIIL